MAHKNNATAVGPQPLRISAQIGDRICDIRRLLFDGGIGDEAIVDAGKGIALVEIMRCLILTGGIALVAALPAAAMDEYHQWRAVRLGAPEIEFL